MNGFSRLFLLCMTLVLLVPGAAVAQEDIEIALFRPRVDVTLDAVGEADFSDMAGTFNTNLASLSANIPLGSTRVRPENSIIGYQFFLQTQLGTRKPEISFIDRDHTLYDGSLRGAVLMARQNGTLILISAGVSFAEDDETRDDPDPRSYGAGLATRRTGEHIILAYGGAISYQYGERLVLPLFGLMWFPDSRWSLVTVLPFLARATYDASENVKLHLVLTPAGNRYRFANEGNFPGQPETVYMRLVEVRVGAELEYRATKSFSLLVQAGVSGARKLEFAHGVDSDDEFLSADVDGTSYLRVSARFRFGKSLLDEAGF